MKIKTIHKFNYEGSQQMIAAPDAQFFSLPQLVITTSTAQSKVGVFTLQHKFNYEGSQQMIAAPDAQFFSLPQLIFLTTNAHSTHGDPQKQSFFNTRINTRFLLILSGDIEENPGPGSKSCPCEQSKGGKQIKCCKCKQAWHCVCVGLTGITDAALDKLTGWSCALCIELPPKIKQILAISLNTSTGDQLKTVLESMAVMEENIMKKMEEKAVTTNAAQETSYSDAVMKAIDKNVKKTNEMVRNQMRNANNNEADTTERNKKTRIVRKPKDVNIRNSKDLRKQFNQYFPEVILRRAVISAGGSYVLEFEDEAGANQVQQDWNNDHFAGNSGIVKLDEPNSTGIVKFVYDDIADNVIEAEIEQNYPGCVYELFRKHDQFTGMIKVTFKDEDELNNAIANKFKISRRLYIVEPFKHKPRVIKCNTCQRFGHISRLCRSKDKPVCGKCSCEGHETRDCTKGEEEWRCFHCGKDDHITGSYTCEKVKEKYRELLERQQNV